MSDTYHPAPRTTYAVGIFLLILFILERTAKWLALEFVPRQGWFATGESLGFFVERNQGIAFSIALPPWLLGVVVFAIVVFFTGLGARALRKGEIPVIWGSGFIVIGAVSNAIDRIRFDYVIDFIRITRWPTFNLADIFILLGVSILIVYLFKEKSYARPTHDRLDHRN